MKKEQLCVGQADISVPYELTKSQIMQDLRDVGLQPPAFAGDAVEFLPSTGTKVRLARVTFAYRAHGANTDDQERMLTTLVGSRVSVTRVGVFHLDD